MPGLEVIRSEAEQNEGGAPLFLGAVVILV